ncbi:type II toxin-antitoxin system toxin DNA ADP-ribosyl transferase DarT [Citrobacter freundii]|nr:MULTISPECIES: DarT ssDNA thymidine ADP-ribosyltransferase family protein [Enterobacteriaceae]HCT9707686.1 DUF4433 domain-containing protein [Citrobacter werkmanii]EKU4982908.1 DUF4433 domain-containing protein [Klebsiella aerogenes]EKV4069040.1 DUF4433 domain-containing protein [Citrobacter freundii]EKW1509897.1 DUF4433 domain-containing protein [Citrobacter freundii]KDF28707.1 hypothetical protein AE04_04585 [Klebsiella aerogenes MGH 78]
MIPQDFLGRFVYHFTSVYNLKSIIRDGLLSTNLKNKLNIKNVDISNKNIQARRSQMLVPCGRKGVVHDYVPFYFAKRTPMLLNVVKSKNYDQVDIMFLAVPIEKVLEKNVVFSDASANTNLPPSFYSEPKDLENLNWEIIDNPKWSYPDDNERHQKMAEMLIHDKVEINEVSFIVVWNDNFKEYVQSILNRNSLENIKVVTDYEKYFKHHYFSLFNESGRKNIITGPRVLLKLTNDNIDKICDNRQQDCRFDGLEELVNAIEDDFSCIKELKEIEGLITDNIIHKESVSDHSCAVAALVKQDDKFEKYNKNQKLILVLSAYLHDIGKGPKSRWPKGIQKVDDDHPRKSLPMLERILCNEVSGLTRRDIRRIHMLVVYDDLVGDIVAKGRNKCQFQEVICNKIDVDLLISIAKADMGAINPVWVENYQEAIEELRQEMYDFLEKTA